MKHRVKIKGRLRLYFQASLLMGIFLALIDFYILNVDAKAGILLSAFVLLYLVTSLVLLGYNRSIIMNELISFATQYGQIQKVLLRELELPYAMLDDEGHIIWTNSYFEHVVHKDKGYRKSITSLFPSITKEKLPEEKRKISAVLEDKNGIIWAEHAGVDERVKTDENTVNYLIIGI